MHCLRSLLSQLNDQRSLINMSTQTRCIIGEFVCVAVQSGALDVLAISMFHAAV